jgi:hypothetical protein
MGRLAGTFVPPARDWEAEVFSKTSLYCCRTFFDEIPPI